MDNPNIIGKVKKLSEHEDMPSLLNQSKPTPKTADGYHSEGSVWSGHQNTRLQVTKQPRRSNPNEIQEAVAITLL